MGAARIGVTAASVLLLAGAAGCGGDTGSPSASRASATPTTTAPAGESLREICPKVAAALNTITGDSSYDSGPYVALGSQLQSYADSADIETSNALKLLLAPVNAMANDPADKSAAHREVLNGVGEFAQRCKAAGSDALQ